MNRISGRGWSSDRKAGAIYLSDSPRAGPKRGTVGLSLSAPRKILHKKWSSVRSSRNSENSSNDGDSEILRDQIDGSNHYESQHDLDGTAPHAPQRNQLDSSESSKQSQSPITQYKHLDSGTHSEHPQPPPYSPPHQLPLPRSPKLFLPGKRITPKNGQKFFSPFSSPGNSSNGDINDELPFVRSASTENAVMDLPLPDSPENSLWNNLSSAQFAHNSRTPHISNQKHQQSGASASHSPPVLVVNQRHRNSSQQPSQPQTVSSHPHHSSLSHSPKPPANRQSNTCAKGGSSAIETFRDKVDDDALSAWWFLTSNSESYSESVSARSDEKGDVLDQSNSFSNNESNSSEMPHEIEQIYFSSKDDAKSIYSNGSGVLKGRQSPYPTSNQNERPTNDAPLKRPKSSVAGSGADSDHRHRDQYQQVQSQFSQNDRSKDDGAESIEDAVEMEMNGPVSNPSNTFHPMNIQYSYSRTVRTAKTSVASSALATDTGENGVACELPLWSSVDQAATLSSVVDGSTSQHQDDVPHASQNKHEPTRRNNAGQQQAQSFSIENKTSSVPRSSADHQPISTKRNKGGDYTLKEQELRQQWINVIAMGGTVNYDNLSPNYSIDASTVASYHVAPSHHHTLKNEGHHGSSPDWDVTMTPGKRSRKASVEWTPQDSSYGAAVPAFGWIPKNIRKLIEMTAYFMLLTLLIFFVVKTGMMLGGGSARSGSSGGEDDFWDDDDHYLANYPSNYKYDDDAGNGRDNDHSNSRHSNDGPERIRR